ncbi:MAG: DUF748 domain-containing protein [Sulfurimonas sp.]|jgi:hypothetical protein
MSKRIQKIVLFILATYTILGFIILPFVLKSQIIKSVQKETNTAISIENIAFNPFTFVLNISGITLKSNDDKFGFTLKSLTTDLQASSLLNLHIHMPNITLEKMAVNDFVSFDFFSLENTTIALINKTIHIQKIDLDSLSAMLKRDAKAKIDLLENIKTIKINFDANPQVSSDTNASTPWSMVIDAIALQKIKVAFKDETINPSVLTAINDLNLFLQNVTLEGNEPLLYQLNMNANKDLNCSSSGSVKYKVLEVNSSLECSGLDVVHYKPYIDKIAKKELEIYDLNLVSLIAGFDVNLTLKEAKPEMILNVNNANIHLNKFALNKKSTGEKVANFNSLAINKVSLNTKTRHVEIKNTTLDKLDINAKRYKNNNLNIVDLIVPKQEANKSEQKPEYTLKLGHVQLREAKLSFEDEAVIKGAKNKIDTINLNIYGIDSKINSLLKYDLSLRVNEGGYVKSKGSLKHTPLEQEGTLELQKVSLKELTPYVKEKAFLSIDDGYLSIKAKTKYKESSRRSDLKVVGSMKLEDFFVSDSRNKTTLLSFSDVKLKSFTYEMFPNRLFVDEVDVNSFYINALIDENKKMNLSSLIKPTKEATQTKEKENFPVKIMKINVTNGSANFSDLSLAIKFKTNIHDLNGLVYAVSNMPNDTSYIDIAGEVDRYGSTKLKGSVNTGNPKAFTGLDFNFQNLDLEAMSGYSASLAGYKINNGKLFLDLRYDIQNSELLGQNSIIIKNIELGDEVKDNNQSSLPLKFVISLLEDSEGVIDINMPVQGNVDAPDFKYGALVWKTFGRMVFKAVASPFNILGSIIGVDGDKLEYTEFEGGSTKILPPEQEKLDTVAKLLVKKPKVIITIGGRYDTQLDKRALQKEKHSNLVIKKSKIKNRENQVSTVNIDLLEEIYKEFTNDNKLSIIKNTLKKQYKGEELTRAYTSALFEECIKFQIVTEEEMKILAQKRAEAIQSYLVINRGADASRITIADIGEAQNDENRVKTKLQVDVK